MQRDTTDHTDGTRPNHADPNPGTYRQPWLRRASVALAAALVLGITPTAIAAEPSPDSCWGQASAASAQQEPGSMGDHASGYGTPRLGLRNLARSLGFDSMADLGAFVVDAEGLEVPACE